MKSVRAEENRFRARLRRVLILGLAGAPAAGAACSTAGALDPATRDAGTPGDSGASWRDASVDPADATSPVDAGLPLDAAPEADPCAPVEVDPSVFGTDGACDDFVRLPCGIPPDASRIGCSPNVDLCTTVCPGRAFFECSYPSVTCDEAGALVPDAEVVIECGLCVGNLGRRPRGLRDPGASHASSAAGDYFARAAFLEAASVDAFERLQIQLTALGAPRTLRQRTAEAALDERRHARTTARLARHFGGEPAVARLDPIAPTTLEALAHENAVEGCVRESFAALLAMHQAAHAADPGVARALRGIARDEARHAALAWSIHAWASARLGSRARASVERGGEEALAALEAGAGGIRRSPADEEVARIAGLPSPALEKRLVEAFREAFFAPVAPSRRAPKRAPGNRARRVA